MKYGYETEVALENYYHTEALDQCKNEEATMMEKVRHEFKLKVIEKQFEEESSL